MESSKKFLPIFDALLASGLGCGVLGLCLLMCGFLYIWQNPSLTRPAPTPVGLAGSPTISPVSTAPFFDLATPTSNIALPPTLISSPISGDGSSAGKIAFTCFINQIDQICIMNADGSGRKQLTDFKATAYYASLSPDGQTIYFVSRQTGNYEIYSMDINGNGVKQFTNGIGSLSAPELSPDGTRIIFTNSGNGLWVMNADGSDPHAITFRDDIDPTWSPDGSMIAFASNRSGKRQLYVASANGKKVTQVTDLNDMGGRSTWSPDGKSLAFYRGPAGDHDIFIINVDGTGLERLTHGGDNLGPSWSPDGEWIAFTSFRDGNNEIYIVHPDGRGLTRLTNNFTSDWQPRWGH
jgi:tol-pal system beta propeller repeat protein TolB